jgi:glutathione S-transferase
MLKVLGRVTSINVRKVLWALDELGVSYEREDWGLPIRDPKVPEFLALNPNGQVPVLIEGEFVLWESNAIMVYLAEADASASLLPPEPQGRARVHQWLGWQVSDLNPAWMYAIHALIRRTPGYDDAARAAESMAKWGSRMAILEGQLAKGEGFVAGAQFSIADIALGLSVHRWMAVPTEKPDFPAIADYYRRLMSREAGARWMAPETP